MFRALVGDFDFTVLVGPNRATTNKDLGAILCISYIVITDFVVLSMLLAILDHAYEDVRDELLEKEETDEIRHFNEDFNYCATLPATLLDKGVRYIIETTSGTEYDKKKIRERRRVDPAMLHVLKFEKMAIGDTTDAAQLAAAAERKKEREAADCGEISH